MLTKRSFLLPAALFVLGLTANIAPASAEQWYFYVKNGSSATLKSLLVSENGSSWGHFDIGSGIAPGENTKLVWDKSTNNEACTQSVKATFSDGTESTPVSIDFCKDLDDPIVFKD